MLNTVRRRNAIAKLSPCLRGVKPSKMRREVHSVYTPRDSEGFFIRWIAKGKSGHYTLFLQYAYFRKGEAKPFFTEIVGYNG